MSEYLERLWPDISMLEWGTRNFNRIHLKRQRETIIKQPFDLIRATCQHSHSKCYPSIFIFHSHPIFVVPKWGWTPHTSIQQTGNTPRPCTAERQAITSAKQNKPINREYTPGSVGRESGRQWLGTRINQGFLKRYLAKGGLNPCIGFLESICGASNHHLDNGKIWGRVVTEQAWCYPLCSLFSV